MSDHGPSEQELPWDIRSSLIDLSDVREELHKMNEKLEALLELLQAQASKNP